MRVFIGLALLAAPAALMAQTVTKCRTDAAGNLICESQRQQQTGVQPDWTLAQPRSVAPVTPYVFSAEADAADRANRRRKHAFKLIVKGQCQEAEDYALRKADMVLLDEVRVIRADRGC
ncbi:MAG: hypothetical protein C0456_19270 [Hyphomonas sp.]|uniref:hypothetical protein n=1 Tax=Hyphomonas sp. TaxID=87 RepID=UPI001D28052A|nr:hypothetical protein [Hyphomonas sp.]MBA4228749.1 hypothetical protein [Hyphomonas sp.]